MLTFLVLGFNNKNTCEKHQNKTKTAAPSSEL